MGMYIIGEKPDRCGVCPCFHAENPMYCQAVKAAVQKPRIVRPYANGRPDWCPLISVPEPHGRLIDADEFLKRAIGTKCFRGDYALMLEELVGESTTIIQPEEET